MAEPNVQLFDNLGVELTSFSFTNAVPGSQSDEQVVEVWNNKGGTGADTARNREVLVGERRAGETVWLFAGRELVDGRHVKVRIIGGLNGLSIASTSHQGIGAGRGQRLPAIPNDQGVQLGVVVDLPLGFKSTDIEVLLRTAGVQLAALMRGLTEGGVGDGVYLGLSDGERSQLMRAANTVQNPAGANDQVEVQDTEGVAAGDPYAHLKQLIQLDNLDGSGTALAAGEAYWGLVHVDSAGALAVLKSDKAATPLDPALQPDTPPLAKALAMVLRDDTGMIEDADITQLWQLDAGLPVVTGLNVSYGPSEGLIEDGWWWKDTTEELALPDASTIHVWRLPDGTVTTTTDGSRPDPRALLLYVHTTAAGAVTATERRHRWLGLIRELLFVLDGPLDAGASPIAYASWPEETDLLVLPHQAVAAQLIDDAGTGGQTRIDIEYAEAANPLVWTTLFTGGQTPTIPQGSSTLADYDAIVEVHRVPRRSILRAQVVESVTGGGFPSGAVLALRGQAA